MLCIAGLQIHKKKNFSVMQASLVEILHRIESSIFESMKLKFLVDADVTLAYFNSQSLESVLLMHDFLS